MAFASVDPIELYLGFGLLDRLDFDRSQLVGKLAKMGEDQTRDRLSFEKQAPDGSAWPTWSAQYAATREGGQSLLQDSRALTDSIRSFADGDVAVWGTNLVYAGIHQDGGQTKPHEIAAKSGGYLHFNGVFRKSVQHPGSTIPQRQFIGMSPGNADDLEAEALEFLGGLLRF